MSKRLYVAWITNPTVNARRYFARDQIFLLFIMMSAIEPVATRWIMAVMSPLPKRMPVVMCSPCVSKVPSAKRFSITLKEKLTSNEKSKRFEGDWRRETSDWLWLRVNLKFSSVAAARM
jgi:hypothetical protein